MEPSKDAISVRLAKLNNQFLGRSTAGKRSLHRDGLLDALSVLYDECNNETLKKGDVHIAKFVEKYRSIFSELRQLRVNISDFEVKDIIGRGQFGEVHVVREKQTGDVYAMKSVRKESSLKAEAAASLEEERIILAAGASPWLLALQYAFQDASQLYLVMEFMAGGDLGELLERRGRRGLPEEQARSYLAQLLLAVHALHSLGFIHRDLKPDNVLIDRCGHLKLGDFGSAARLGPSGLVRAPAPVGTPHYIAPELLRALEDPKIHPHGTPCDYWSLGVVAFELITGRTPWASAGSAGQVYSAILRHTAPPFLSSPSTPSAPYRDLVMRLMAPEPTTRPTHEQLMRHELFARTQWGSLREETPHHVPSLRAEDDVSNFSRPERLQRVPSIGSLRTRTTFSGRNLPFVGFTYAPEVSMAALTNGGVEAGSDGEGEVAGEGEPFLNASLNSTAICFSTFREMESLLESRRKEIEDLHKRLARAECAATLGEERARRLQELEEARSRLERELADMACHNQKLQRGIEAEHRERAALEQRSLAAVRAARSQWEQQRVTEQGVQRELKARQSEQCAQLQATVQDLVGRLKASTAELNLAQKQLEGLQKLQKDHKESMVKARRLTQQSLVSLDSERERGERERELRDIVRDRQHSEQLDELRRQLAGARDTEQNLRVELQERHKDYADAALRGEQLRPLQAELCALRNVCADLKRMRDEGNTDTLIMQQEKNELQSRVEELEFTVCSLESDALEWKGEEAILRERLSAANKQEDKYRRKVTELEELLSKLQEEVARLEDVKTIQTADVVPKGEEKEKKRGKGERMTFLEERVSGLELQLKSSHEEAALLKQEARKTSSALWKKEKELTDCDLDRRIAVRELKQAEERVKVLGEEKGAVEGVLGGAQEELRTARGEARRATAALAQATAELAQLKAALDKLTAEHDRCANDMMKMKGELQYSEARRLQGEGRLERAERQLQERTAERLTEREERARLQELLHQREEQQAGLAHNHRMLQEACTMLEEQLLDFERLTELQEATNAQLKEEKEQWAEQLETLRAEVSAGRRTLEREEARHAEAVCLLQDARNEGRLQRDRNMDLEKQLDELLEREGRLQSEVEERANAAEREGSGRSRAESQLAALRAHDVALKEELAVLHSQNQASREDAMRAQQELREGEERVQALRGLLEEMEAQAQHWRQRELKAEATIHQHLKLIDFLQAKVEEASKKKKGLGELLWGRATKENLPPSLSSTPTPLRDRQINKELREQVSELRQRLQSVEGREEPDGTPRIRTGSSRSLKATRLLEDCAPATPSTPRALSATSAPSATCAPCPDSKQIALSDQPLMEGWVRIEKEGLLERVYMELRGCGLSWRGARAPVRLGGARVLPAPPPSRLLLSKAEASTAFVLKIADSLSLVVVCPSASQRSDWLAGLAEAEVVVQDEGKGEVQEEGGGGQAWGRQLAASAHTPTFLLEVDSDVLLIGTVKGLSSWVRGRDGASPLCCWEQGGVLAGVLAPPLDVCLLLPSGGAGPRLLSLRQLICALRALPTSRPVLPAPALALPLEAGETCLALRLCPRRALLLLATSRHLHLLPHCARTAAFLPGRRLVLPGAPRALALTAHTALLAAPLPLELDLATLALEDFLDPSDSGLGSLRGRSPLEILRVRDGASDGCAEYLLCYKELGVFVDGYGQRSRARDMTWGHLPLSFIFRKPFLYTFHATCVDIFLLDDSSYRHNLGELDDESVSTMSTSSATTERVTIELPSPKLLGKSSAKGSVYVSTSADRKTSQILELYGGDVFMNNLGMSMETLNFNSDVDSCRRLEEPETTSVSTTEEEAGTDFLAHIRQKARLLNSIKSETDKVSSVGELLAGRGRQEEGSDDSELSSSYDERDREALVSSDSSKKQVRFHHH